MLDQLFLALILGGFLGLEREIKKKPAGLQTYSLVSLASCLFGLLGFGGYVVIGVGFLGAGVIFKKDEKIYGLTTAGGLWLAAAIGVAVGLKEYSLALGSAFLGVIVLFLLHFLEKKIS